MKNTLSNKDLFFSKDKYFGYYSILRVPCNASFEHITHAYIALSLSVNGKKSLDELTEAYEVLSNEKTRQEHDELLSAVIQKRNERLQLVSSRKDEILLEEKKERSKKNNRLTYFFCLVFLLAILFVQNEPIAKWREKNNFSLMSNSLNEAHTYIKNKKEETSNRSKQKPTTPQSKSSFHQPSNTVRDQVF